MSVQEACRDAIKNLTLSSEDNSFGHNPAAHHKVEILVRAVLIAASVVALLGGCSPQPYRPYSYNPASAYTTPSTPVAQEPVEQKVAYVPPGGWAANRVKLTKDLEKAIERAVKEDLKDPESAMFKHTIAFKDKDESITACGLVNSKNSYGGYVGDKAYRATVMLLKGKYLTGFGILNEGKYPQVFYEVNPMCDPLNWK
jgi:hypothetical protein